MWSYYLARKRKNLLHKQKQKKAKNKIKTEPKPKHYRGTYKNIVYESSLELATILHCENVGFKIKNYNLSPIDYFDPQTKAYRKYYPDFIINDFLIIEVKWIGFVYKKYKEEIYAKRKALEKFCETSDKYTTLFVSNNMIKKKFVKLAKQIHEKMLKKEIKNG